MEPALIGFTAVVAFKTNSKSINVQGSPARYAVLPSSGWLLGSAAPIIVPIANPNLGKNEPMSTPLLIISGIVLVIVGFILALLVTPLLGFEDKPSDGSTKKGEDLEKKISTPTFPPADRSLRVSHDPRDNKLIIEIDGQVYDTVDRLSQEQRRFLSGISTELVSWMSLAVMQSSLPPSSNQPTTKEKVAEPIPPAPDRNMVNSFLRVLQPSPARAPSQPKSLAAQVDEVLQEKLPNSGLPYRTIHLVDLPNYGMSVQVDWEQYPSIDEVPDEAVRKLIREAVEEWKRRSSLSSR
jgi:hypothetical protein